MEVLTFNVDMDRRNLVSDIQNFKLDFSGSKYSWVQARQYERQMRQVQVDVVHGDNTPFDITGCNPVLEGLMPDGTHRIIDAKHGVMLDPVNGQFRFDFPAQAFAVAGSYKQIFFRLFKDGNNVATLEFSMEVMADKVISGLVPADYITPFEDLYGQLEDIVKNGKGDLDAALKEWTDKLSALFTTLTNQGTNTATMLTTLEAQIKADGLLTQSALDSILSKYKTEVNSKIESVHLLTSLKIGRMTLADSDNIYPNIHAYIYQYGAGIAQANIDIGGGSTVYDIPVRAERLTPTSINIYIDSEAAKKLFSGFSMVDNPEVSVDGSFAYVTSGSYGLAIEAKESTVTGFTVDSAFKI